MEFELVEPLPGDPDHTGPHAPYLPRPPGDALEPCEWDEAEKDDRAIHIPEEEVCLQPF